MSPTREELDRARTYQRSRGRRFVEKTPTKAARCLPRLAVDAARTTAVRTRAERFGYAEGILEQLTASERCRICGRDLTDPTSVQRGIGPDCIAKLRAQAELEKNYRDAMTALGVEPNLEGEKAAHVDPPAPPWPGDPIVLGERGREALGEAAHA